MINQYLGGPFVTPWEVPDLPDELTDLIIGLANELPGIQVAQRNVEDHFSAWRRKMNYKHGK